MKAAEHLQRREVMECLALTNRIRQRTRYYLEKQGFTEFDTPVLAVPGGERYNPTFPVEIDGEELSLSDSPQVYKMLFMLAGYDRYYQFAHCFRPIAHEKNKETRLCEFVQIDVELHVESLHALIREAVALLETICADGGRKISVRFMDGLWCRENFGEEMKPDLRENPGEISLVVIDHMPLTNGERTGDHVLIPNHHIFAAPENFGKAEDLMNTTTQSFDIVLNGIEIGGGDMRIMDACLQEKMMEIFSVDKKRYCSYLEELAQYKGTPTGGFAIGLQRLVMALAKVSDIRETVAFPDWR